MKWSEELYEQNCVEVRENASTIARLLVDEAEAFVVANNDRQPGTVAEIVAERLDMLEDAIYDRINQQLVVRGHIEED